MGFFNDAEIAGLEELATDHLSDQSCTVKRLTETQGTSGGIRQALANIAVNVPCAIVKPSRPMEMQLGNSERNLSQREIHIQKDTDIRSGDVVSVTDSRTGYVGDFDVIDTNKGRTRAPWITAYVNDK